MVQACSRMATRCTPAASPDCGDTGHGRVADQVFRLVSAERPLCPVDDPWTQSVVATPECSTIRAVPVRVLEARPSPSTPARSP